MYKALFTAEDFSSLLAMPTNGEPALVVGGRVKHRCERKRAVKHRESAILRQRAPSSGKPPSPRQLSHGPPRQSTNHQQHFKS